MSKISFNKRIGLFKQMIQSFRKTHGWQTDDGRRRISEARTGTYPVKDASTGRMIGSVHKDHPKVLSGEWVHHSANKVSVTNIETCERSYIDCNEYRENRSMYKANVTDSKGSKNPNYKEMTEERKQRLFNLVPSSVEDGHLISNILLNNIKNEFTEFKKVSMVWVTNNFGSIGNLVKEYNIERNENVKYHRYFRSTSTKKKISKGLSDNRWVTDGAVNIAIKQHELDDFLNNNKEFHKGRTHA